MAAANHKRPRVLALGLDAFEMSVAEPLMAAGQMPHLKRLLARSAAFRLHHDGRFTGLAWEHFSTGRAPKDQQRWSAVSVNPATYSVTQTGTDSAPFLAGLDLKVVMFDVPYFDLAKSPGAVGVANWGAHDPGTPLAAYPPGLDAEITSRFGPYPAPEWIYGFCWPSVTRTEAAGAALTEAVKRRAAIARWLLAERAPDWDVGLVVVAEPHSTIEPLWHGIDPSHPLHAIPSAPAARAGIESVYRAVDDMIGSLAEAFPDATLLVFSMHGMGPNIGDVPGMVLVPELLYRHAFGRPYSRPLNLPRLPNGALMLGEDEAWDEVMRTAVPYPLAGRVMGRLRRLVGDRRPSADREKAGNLGWMPAARYAHFWPRMRAFGMPAYYDAQVRVNLAGREAQGMVPLAEYAAVRQQVVDLVAECRDAVTDRPVLHEAIFARSSPLEVGPSEADVSISIAPNTTGLLHPRLGTIGPYPFRRTGGHTGDWGFLYATGVAVAGDRGVADSYDVAPTLLALAGAPAVPGLSGKSLLPRLAGRLAG